jgi:hypothetical protein
MLRGSASNPVPRHNPSLPCCAVTRQPEKTDREIVGGGRLAQHTERVDAHLDPVKAIWNVGDVERLARHPLLVGVTVAHGELLA